MVLDVLLGTDDEGIGARRCDEAGEEGKQRKETVYWRARTIAMHELDHIGDLENKLIKK